MKIIESYKRTLNNTRILPKITSFLIAIFLFSEIFQSLYSYYSMSEEQFNSSQDWIYQVWRVILISIGIKAIIALFFLLRFILLWYRESKFIWFSQIIWVICWLSIIAFKLFTTKFLYGSFLQNNNEIYCLDCFYYNTFLETSAFLTVVLLAYLYLSPLKQILVFIFSLGNRKIPNHVMKSEN